MRSGAIIARLRARGQTSLAMLLGDWLILIGVALLTVGIASWTSRGTAHGAFQEGRGASHGRAHAHRHRSMTSPSMATRTE